MTNPRVLSLLLAICCVAVPSLAAAQKAPVKKAPAKTVAAPADVAAPPADAAVTASGLASKVLKAGKGTVHPAVTDRVEVHYSGWTVDGKMFDSSVVRGKPLTFALNQVIAGWSEGVQLMVAGEKRRLWIPARLAYEGVADRPQGTLVFDVELLKILPAPLSPPLPLPTPSPLPPSPAPPPS